MTERVVLDLFAGPGGWSEGLRSLGYSDFGIELDATACDTRYAAGHASWHADVEQVDPGMFDELDVWGVIASPPCPDWSQAGRRAGIGGDSGRLIWEPMRFVSRLAPAWVAMEQVPPALDIWKMYCQELHDMGYGTWCGILNAADYGVPQTRERAILMAVLDGVATPPEPTHADGGADAGMFSSARLPWVSMTDALGWPPDWEIEYQRGEGMVERHGTRPGRKASEPCFTLRAGAYGESFNFRVRTGTNSMKHSRRSEDMVPYERDGTLPAPTVDCKAVGAWKFLATNRGQDDNGDRQIVTMDRPAPTVTGKAPSQWDFDGEVKMTIRQALTLQGFPADYPVQGNKTKQSEQVGNAVPPPLASSICRSLITVAEAVAGPGHVEDVPVSASEPNPPKAGR